MAVSFDALLTDEDHAASAIQARYRGSASRRQLRAHADDSEPSVPFTAELARELALESSISTTANGLQVACPRLVATGRRLAGSLAQTLGSLPHLTALDLSHNHLHSLIGLEALPSLHKLACRSNRLLGALDYPAPSTGSRLRDADLRDNLIAGAVSLPPDMEGGRAVGVDAHSGVESLLLDGNRLRSLRGVSAARRLRTFSAARNALQDTAGLEGLAELRHLDLSSNVLQGCDELSKLTGLRTLKLHENQIGGLPDLKELQELHTLTLAVNALSSLTAVAEAVGGHTLKQEMDTDGDGFIDSVELAHWQATEGSRKAKSLRTLTLAGNPLLKGLADARLRVLHALPTVALLDGAEVTPEEVVASRGLHGDDTPQLLAIRQRLWPEVHQHNTVASVLWPGLAHEYCRQHSAAWQAGEPER